MRHRFGLNSHSYNTWRIKMLDMIYTAVPSWRRLPYTMLTVIAQYDVLNGVLDAMAPLMAAHYSSCTPWLYWDFDPRTKLLLYSPIKKSRKNESSTRVSVRKLNPDHRIQMRVCYLWGNCCSTTLCHVYLIRLYITLQRAKQDWQKLSIVN